MNILYELTYDYFVQAVKEFVNCDEYGSPIDCHLESHHPIDTIELKIPSEIYGWIVENDEKLKLGSLVGYKVNSVHLRCKGKCRKEIEINH